LLSIPSLMLKPSTGGIIFSSLNITEKRHTAIKVQKISGVLGRKLRKQTVSKLQNERKEASCENRAISTQLVYNFGAKDKAQSARINFGQNFIQKYSVNTTAC